MKKANLVAEVNSNQFIPNNDAIFWHRRVNSTSTNYFQQNNSTPLDNSMPYVSKKQIKHVIKTLAAQKAPERTNISNKALKNLPVAIIAQLI